MMFIWLKFDQYYPTRVKKLIKQSEYSTKEGLYLTKIGLVNVKMQQRVLKCVEN